MKLRFIEIMSILLIITGGLFIAYIKIDDTKEENILKEEKFNRSLEDLNSSKDWLYETLELLNKKEIEVVMYSYASKTNIKLTNIIDTLYENCIKDELNQIKYLKNQWYLFSDNIELAYSNKTNGMSYDKELKTSIEKLKEVINTLENIVDRNKKISLLYKRDLFFYYSYKNIGTDV